MGLLDGLFGGAPQAQGPGQRMGLRGLLDPEIALPMAAALMGQQGNGQNFSNALGTAGPTIALRNRRNETAEFFKKNAPEFAQMIEAGMPVGTAWQTYAGQRFAEPTDPYKSVGGHIFNTEDQSWISPPESDVAETGLVPQMMRDPETGRTIYVQPTKDGRLVPSEVPDGFEPYSPFEKSFQTKSGDIAAENAGALPGAQATASMIDKQIQSLKNDPYLPRMLGPFDSRLPTITADGARVQSKIDQLQGGAFLQARQMLKGGGAISDTESIRAERAFSRMNQAQSVDDFKAALDEFNDAVKVGLAKLGGVPSGPAGGGSMRDKYGLD
jgi:hypothetical protein